MYRRSVIHGCPRKYTAKTDEFTSVKYRYAGVCSDISHSLAFLNDPSEKLDLSHPLTYLSKYLFSVF